MVIEVEHRSTEAAIAAVVQEMTSCWNKHSCACTWIHLHAVMCGVNSSLIDVTGLELIELNQFEKSSSRIRRDGSRYDCRPLLCAVPPPHDTLHTRAHDTIIWQRGQ